MVVELSLAAVIPGLLVGLHYGVQIARPLWGHGSDKGGRRTPWIIGGIALLAIAGVGAAVSTAMMADNLAVGLALAAVDFILIGMGIGAAGTSLLALLASSVAPERRPAAATVVWLMMIFGIAVTAGGVGAVLDPYSPGRLVQVVAAVCCVALALTALAMWGIEARLDHEPAPQEGPTPFRAALREIWDEPRARAFSIFVFLSMTAYFMQELIIEPFAGHVFGFTPGESTSMAGLQNGGVFLGMLTVGIAASGLKLGSLKMWTALGCAGSAAALGAVAFAGFAGPPTPLLPPVAALGFFNGVFAVAAIGSMMQLAGEGRGGREGTRMGLFGAAQAMAAGFGGFVGAAAVDLMRLFTAEPEAYGAVFLAEAALFLFAAFLAFRVVSRPAPQPCPGV
jgi:BCD family chlorophyll transporter-like MFS transporter